VHSNYWPKVVWFFHYFYLYNYYNYFQTLCIKFWILTFHIEICIIWNLELDTLIRYQCF
jgi:hypothetical protein